MKRRRSSGESGGEKRGSDLVVIEERLAPAAANLISVPTAAKTMQRTMLEATHHSTAASPSLLTWSYG
eukprot:3933531-Rhodomonas_salina.1